MSRRILAIVSVAICLLVVTGAAYWWLKGPVQQFIASRGGVTDRTGTFAIRPQFETAYQFSEGLAAVQNTKTRGGWSYIDKTGKVAFTSPSISTPSPPLAPRCSLGMPRWPPSPGFRAGQTAGQAIQEGSTIVSEPSVSFAGNPTDDPELRHTEGRGSPGPYRMC